MNFAAPFGGYKQSGVRPRARPRRPRGVPRAQGHQHARGLDPRRLTTNRRRSWSLYGPERRKFVKGYAPGRMDLRYTEHEEAFRGELREWLEGVVPALPAKPKEDDWDAAAGVRHRVAADAVRRRVRGDQLAEGVRRPGRHAHRAPHLHRGDRAGAGALRGVQLRRPAPRRAHADRRRLAGAEGEPPARHPQGRAGLVSGVLRAERGVRPRQPADARRARRRRVRAQRPEDLDQLRPRRRVLRDARAHEPRPRGAQAGRDHLADRAHGRRRHRHPPAAGDGGHHRVLRGLPRRRPRAGEEPRRRRERRLARRQRHPQLRAGHRVRRRRDGDRRAPAATSSSWRSTSRATARRAGRTPASGATSATSAPSSTRSGR